MAWTDERVKIAQQMWADGHSASQIASRLGGFTHCTDGGRSAVIGKLFRVKTPGRKNPSRKKSHVRRRPLTKKQQFTFGSLRPQTPAQALAARLIRHPIPDPQPGDVARKTYDELDEHKDCKFIPGDPRGGPDVKKFCGLPREPGLPYCATHAMRCYGHTPERPAVKVRPGPILTRAAGTKVFDYA